MSSPLESWCCPTGLGIWLSVDIRGGQGVHAADQRKGTPRGARGGGLSCHSPSRLLGRESKSHFCENKQTKTAGLTIRWKQLQRSKSQKTGDTFKSIPLI